MLPIVYRYLPHLFVVAVASAGIAYAGFHVREGVRRELEPKIARLEAELAAERADRKRSEAASSAYQAELDDLRNRPVPRASVRLCRAPAVFAPGKAPGGTDGATTPAGSRPEGVTDDSGERAGPDIGPDLYALAASCDAVAARLRALQGWVAAP